MRCAFLVTMLLSLGLASSSRASDLDLASSSIRYFGSSPRSLGGEHYRVEGDWRDHHFAFTNRSGRTVYYLIHRSDVLYIAGQPFHYERRQFWGRWNEFEYQLRDVRLTFRRVRAGETIRFRITREHSIWPWRMGVLFYEKPEFNARTGMVSSDVVYR